MDDYSVETYEQAVAVSGTAPAAGAPPAPAPPPAPPGECARDVRLVVGADALHKHLAADVALIITSGGGGGSGGAGKGGGRGGWGQDGGGGSGRGRGGAGCSRRILLPESSPAFLVHACGGGGKGCGWGGGVSAAGSRRLNHLLARLIRVRMRGGGADGGAGRREHRLLAGHEKGAPVSRASGCSRCSLGGGGHGGGCGGGSRGGSSVGRSCTQASGAALADAMEEGDAAPQTPSAPENEAAPAERWRQRWCKRRMSCGSHRVTGGASVGAGQQGLALLSAVAQCKQRRDVRIAREGLSDAFAI